MDREEFRRSVEDALKALGSDRETAEEMAGNLIEIFGEDIDTFQPEAKEKTEGGPYDLSSPDHPAKRLWRGRGRERT